MITAFVGAPIPGLDIDSLGGRAWLLFFEPYYRPGFHVGGDALATVHELGLLIKFAGNPF